MREEINAEQRKSVRPVSIPLSDLVGSNDVAPSKEGVNRSGVSMVSDHKGVQYFAGIGGLFMVLMSLISLISPGMVNDNLPLLLMESSYGWFMGVLPMNLINKLMLLSLGISGIVVMNKVYSSLIWSRLVFVSMGVLALMGLFVETSTMFGLVPLFGTQILVHGIFSVLGYLSATAVKD